LKAPKRFRIGRCLGEGGMGIVYEAFDEERGARVALKTVRDLTPDSLARFKQEFRALADVHHPNLVSLGELVSEGDRWFFTMELVLGTDLLAYVRPDDVIARENAPTMSAASFAVAPTVEPVRATGGGTGPRFDEGRLRSSLAQLAAGLGAVHDAGLVHRDVKPSNVRVTEDDRVVLLDFGLVTDGAGQRVSADTQFAGTPVYMAPEQAARGVAGPAADWYAFGVLLYEALTGNTPFDGAPLDILMKKQERVPPAPATVAPGIPEDLDTLCVELLRIDPAARPSGERVRRLLGAAPAAAGETRSSATYTAPFVGRAAELEALRDAFRAHARGAATVLVHGESGVGKSCLVRRFVELLAKDEPDLVMLAGRCFEREAVPYKAFDGIVDALARRLAHQPEATATLFLPTRPAPLLQLFPVLRRVAAFARAAHGPVQAVDPLEIRSRAFAALREMLTRLGDARPLVLAIDDLQWADADSLVLLSEMVRPPDSPHMLLVGTLRATETGRQHRDVSEMLAAIPGDRRRIELTRLSDGEGRELAERLLAVARGDSAANAREIAREAEGHPLFIDALVRHAAVAPGATVTRLEDALWSRVESLEPAARRVMELLAVTGAPITADALAVAAGAEPEAFARRVSLLRVAHLISITGMRGSDTIEPYHDRVRVAVRAHLGEAAAAEHHRVLALALEQTASNDAEAIAHHWSGAGEPGQAAKHALLAADNAATALAFDRAAKLYEMAIELGARKDDGVLLEKLGDALANAGRGARAARAYEEAAHGAPAARALDLRRRAADQLLGAGHLDAAADAIHALLRLIGISLPGSPLAALMSFLLARLWLRLRGLGFVKRDASQIAAEELTRIDVCWSIAFGFGLVDPVRGAAFQAKNLGLALRAGEPFRVARAIAVESAYVARVGGKSWPRTEALVKRAYALAEESGEPAALGQALNSAGIAHYLNGRFEETVDLTTQALDILQTRCTGVAWEIATARSFQLWGSAQLGRLGNLRSLQAAYLRDAQERGDVYAVVTLSAGDNVLSWLAGDDPDGARRATAEAMGRWSKQAFHVEHFYELVALTHVDLYAGRAGDALARMRDRWKPLRRSLMPQTVQLVRIQSLFCRARSALAVASERSDDALLGAAARDARAIERERMPWAQPQAKLVQAAVARIRGDEARAASLLRDAAAGFERAGMALYAAAARRRLGMLVGGDEGRTMREAAEARLAAEGVAAPARLVATLAPGFRD
jgi:hypothetical protein